MWDGKKKAVTFSFDDGLIYDIRLVALMNKYKVKGTFNISLGLLGTKEVYLSPQQVKEVYKGHEVAAHAYTHKDLTKCDDESVIREIEQDRRGLSELVGYEVVGMAYPYGAFNDRVVNLIQNHTEIRYARTVNQAKGFALQTDLFRFKPTTHSNRIEETFSMIDDFLSSTTDEPQLLYIWGHSYEFAWKDFAMTWEKMEELLQRIAGRRDIFYGTNKEILRL